MSMRTEVLEKLELEFTAAELPRSNQGGRRGPTLPSKNRYTAVDQRTGRPYVTSVGTEFRRTMRAKAIAMGLLTVDQLEPVITSGWWRLDLLVFAPRLRHERDVLLPFADSDGCLWPVKDALVKCGIKRDSGFAGILDDDCRVVSDSTFAAYREADPGLVVRLTRVDDPQDVLAERWPGMPYLRRA